MRVVVAVLLAGGVGVALLCCVGMLALSNPFDRLHLLGPASTLAPIAIAAAVLIEEGLGQRSVKSLVVAVLVLGMSPVLTHATARAIRTHEHGDFEIHDDEIVSDS